MEDNFAQFTSAGPTLSFDEEPAPAPAPVLEQAAEQPEPEANGLSEAELKQVDDFVKRIDISNSQAVMNYGAGTQKKMADFTEKALDNARSKDLGEVGDMITSLLGQLKGLNQEEEEKGFLGFFKKGTNKLNNMKAKYAEVETNVTAISNELEKHQIQLMNGRIDQTAATGFALIPEPATDLGAILHPGGLCVINITKATLFNIAL
jgi:uncharacterized protein YaaN involved in tellurite resistance